MRAPGSKKSSLLSDSETAELEALLDRRVPRLLEQVRQMVDIRRAAPAETGARLVWIHGTRALQSAVDHLTAWQVLSHQRPLRVMAHYSLLRTAVDGASRARWLFDPAVDAGIRAGRGYRSELTDRQNVDKIDQLDERLRPDPSQPAGALTRALNDMASAEGVTIGPYKGYKALAAQYGTFSSGYKGSGEYLYSVLSAAAHGHVWAEHLARQAVIRRPGEPDLRARIMDADTALWATEKVLEIVALAVRDAERHASSGEPGLLVTSE